MLKRLKSLFIPQEGNNFRAKLLHPSTLAFLVGIFLFNQTVLNLVAIGSPGVLGYVSKILPEQVVVLTNEKRQEAGLESLQINDSLNESAQRKAADMFAFDYWAHESPSGRSPWDFIAEVGYAENQGGYIKLGENLAKDFAASEGAVDAWMKSTTHRENIMDPAFQEIGVAVVEGTLQGYKTTLVVQHFGKAKDAKENSGIAVQAQEIKPQGESLFSEQKALVMGQDLSGVEQEAPVINPLMVTKTLSALLFGLIILAVIVDAVFLLKKKIHRLSGRNLAHALFLALVFLLIILSQQGVIN
ncbi:MAG: CAP domain-containing protein [Candidatus Shapirobacteria bacterium]